MSKTASEGNLARYGASQAGDCRSGADRQHGAALPAHVDRAGRPRHHPAWPARHARRRWRSFASRWASTCRSMSASSSSSCNAMQGDLGVDVISGRPVADDGHRRAAQHAAARHLGDRPRGGDRHPDRLLCGGQAGQPARPGAGGVQRRPGGDAELCRGDPAALFLLGAAGLVPGARRRRCRQLSPTSCIIWCCRPWRWPSAGSATSRGWCAPRCSKCWASRSSAPRAPTASRSAASS